MNIDRCSKNLLTVKHDNRHLAVENENINYESDQENGGDNDQIMTLIMNRMISSNVDYLSTGLIFDVQMLMVIQLSLCTLIKMFTLSTQRIIYV